MEPFYPLRALVCASCFLVQLEEFETPEQIFSDYAYFSSYSSSWLEHSRRYAEQMIERLGLDGDSQVVEIASNDGYLLQFFHDREISVLGIEPAANVAEVGRREGHPDGRRVLRRGRRAQARRRVRGGPAARQQRARARARPQRLRRRHEGAAQARRRDHDGVPAPDAPDRGQPVGHDLPRALLLLLLPHRQRACSPRTGCACSTSRSCPRTAARCASTRAHADDADKPESAAARELAERERAAGYEQPGHLLGYGRRVEQDKRQILSFLIDLKEQGLRVVAYGAPAKGNTLLNYCGVRRDFIDYTCDLNPHKQGHFLPGSHIPIRSPDADARGQPGRRADPALEPQGRDRRSSSASSASGAAGSRRARRS